MYRIPIRGTSTSAAAALGVVVLTLSTTAFGAPQRPVVDNPPIPQSVHLQADARKAEAAHDRELRARAERLAEAKRLAKKRAAAHRQALAKAAAERRAAAARAARSLASPGSTRALGRAMAASRGWGDQQFLCLNTLWSNESGWSTSAHNASGAYGIPQAKPGSKMASAGSDWATNPRTQIAWGLSYIAGRYGSPCDALSSYNSRGWY
jgi:hypothetical protein